MRGRGEVHDDGGGPLFPRSGGRLPWLLWRRLRRASQGSCGGGYGGRAAKLRPPPAAQRGCGGTSGDSSSLDPVAAPWIYGLAGLDGLGGLF